jgi:hypothetical protein
MTIASASSLHCVIASGDIPEHHDEAAVLGRRKIASIFLGDPFYSESWFQGAVVPFATSHF